MLYLPGNSPGSTRVISLWVVERRGMTGFLKEIGCNLKVVVTESLPVASLNLQAKSEGEDFFPVGQGVVRERREVAIGLGQGSKLQVSRSGHLCMWEGGTLSIRTGSRGQRQVLLV